jgi:hypothetical protein
MTRCSADLERRRHATEDCAITEVREGFTRHLSLMPGYDHRGFSSECGGGGHGQHGMEMRFVLIGPMGATQWLAFITEWVPGRNVRAGHVDIEYPDLGSLMAADLGYHWSTPQYEGQDPRECDLLPGGTCYYDGSGMRAGELLHPFLADGPRAVWERLKSEYDEMASRPSGPPPSRHE